MGALRNAELKIGASRTNKCKKIKGGITMGDKKNYRFETLAIHGGQAPDPATLARGVAVSRTSSFVFKSVQHGAGLFVLKEFGNGTPVPGISR